MDEIVDLLFILVGNSEKHAMAWMFSYNNYFKDHPVNVISQGDMQKVYNYLFYAAYGPY